jgi:hypothetical protein
MAACTPDQTGREFSVLELWHWRRQLRQGGISGQKLRKQWLRASFRRSLVLGLSHVFTAGWPIPTGPVMEDFQFQELFYEWQLKLRPTKPTPNEFVEISHLSLEDSVKVQPEDASVSELKPKWMSGFPELSRKRPDFFARTISFGALDENQDGSIVIRRNLLVPEVAPIQVITVEDLHVPGCTPVKPVVDAMANSAYLTKQASALSKERFGKSAPASGLPIGRDLGDAPPGNMEASVEAWCANSDCTTFTMGRLEARLVPSEDHP